MQVQKDNLERLLLRKNGIKTAIKRQFDIFRDGGVLPSHLDSVTNLPEKEKQDLGILRIQIIDNKLFLEHNVASIYPTSSKRTCNNIIQALSRITKTHKINNVDFICLTIDNINSPSYGTELLENFPVFMSSKNLESKLEKNKPLLIDPYLLDSKNWLRIINQINETVNIYSWNKKNDKIFWRGATTGITYNLENYHKLPRLTLVMLSRSFPELIDARFMHYSNFSPDDSGKYLYSILVMLFDVPNRILESEHLKSKYLISVDGTTAAWLRVPWILLSNSVLLKQESPFTQIFYQELEPYVNYVPLKEDLSDIFEKLEWLKANDEQARIISDNATGFCKTCLMPEDIDEYMALALNEYHSLQKFEPKGTLQPVQIDN